MAMDRIACSYKKATIVICAVNVIVALHILHNLFGPLYQQQHSSAFQINGNEVKYAPEVLKRIREAYEARLAVEPRELIKRVKEIELEANMEAIRGRDAVDIRQKMASHLAQRLKELKEINKQFKQQGLDEWRRKKLEKAKQREEADKAKLGEGSKVEAR